MNAITIYQLNEQDLDQILEKKLSKIQKESAFAKFYHKLVGTSTVCDILGVSNVTVCHYVKDKKLVPTNLGSGKHLFRLSEVLEADFKYKR